jgi:hypothetical protein
VPGFGSTETLEELDPSIPAHATGAFYKMVRPVPVQMLAG